MNDKLLLGIYWIDSIVKVVAVISIIVGLLILITLGLTGNLHFVGSG